MLPIEEPKAIIEADIRLQLPCNALIVGPTQSGKTSLVLQLLQKPCIFNPVPKRVLFCYDLYQEAYGQAKSVLQQNGIQMLLYKGFSDFNLETIDVIDGETILLIDDFSEATSSSNEIARMVTNGRHKRLSLFILWHQLFSKHAPSRTIAQNTRYYFILPSLRLKSQLSILGYQLGIRKELLAAYQYCLENQHEPYHYLMLDLSPLAHELFRFRSAIDHPLRQYCFSL